MRFYLDEEDDGMTREEIKAWRCACGAGPEAIVTTQDVSLERRWNGDRFITVDEERKDVDVTCGKCGADVPYPKTDILYEPDGAI